jgi:DNA-binding NtrC family response regulator
MESAKVLVVDDSRSMRQVLSGTISQMGFQNIKTVSDGDKADSLFKTNKIDLLFLDLEMPGLSGMDTLKKIKQLCATTYVVIISSASTANNVKQAFRLGASGFIVKPFNLQMIEDALNQYKKFKLSPEYKKREREDRLRSAIS